MQTSDFLRINDLITRLPTLQPQKPGAVTLSRSEKSQIMKRGTFPRNDNFTILCVTFILHLEQFTLHCS
jgi:hypothetical protein